MTLNVTVAILVNANGEHEIYRQRVFIKLFCAANKNIKIQCLQTNYCLCSIYLQSKKFLTLIYAEL